MFNEMYRCEEWFIWMSFDSCVYLCDQCLDQMQDVFSFGIFFFFMLNFVGWGQNLKNLRLDIFFY